MEGSFLYSAKNLTGEHAEQLSDHHGTLIVTSQWSVPVDNVTIPTAFFMNLNVAISFKLGDDAAYCTGGDVELLSDLPGSDLAMLVQKSQDGAVVGDEGPCGAR